MRRLKRINEFIKQEVGKIIQKEIHIGKYLITITNVDTAEDLKIADISVSVLPYDKEEEAMRVLKKNAFYIRKFLNRKMKIRFIPRINFIIDKGEKSADVVDLILSKLNKIE